MALTLTSRRVDPLIADAAAAVVAPTATPNPGAVATSEVPPPTSSVPSRQQTTYRGPPSVKRGPARRCPRQRPQRSASYNFTAAEVHAAGDRERQRA